MRKEIEEKVKKYKKYKKDYKCTHSHNICFMNLNEFNMESNFEISCPCQNKLKRKRPLKESSKHLEINLKNEKSEYIKNHISKIQKQNKKN